jgi:hypothetical protein
MTTALHELETGTMHRATEAPGVAACGAVLRPPFARGEARIVAGSCRRFCPECFAPGDRG